MITPAIWMDETGLLYVLWRLRGSYQTITEGGHVGECFHLPAHARPLNRLATRAQVVSPS